MLIIVLKFLKHSHIRNILENIFIQLFFID